jgi:hypothetical protein
MNMRIATSFLLALVVVAIHAQENPDSRVRVFAALPNWNGLWESKSSEASLNLGGHQAVPLGSTLAEVFAQNMKLLAGKPPYTPEWILAREAERKSTPAQAAGGGPASTAKLCTDTQFPAVLDLPLMFQVFVTPEETLFLYETGDVRHVYTDGRKHPKKDDLWPTDKGDSIGHWKGGTLLIDTIEIKSGPIAPYPGVPDLSERAHFTERVRRVDADTLQDDLTIDDPLRFVHPWQLALRYSRVTGLDRMLPYDCTENDRNPVLNGKMTVAPP